MRCGDCGKTNPPEARFCNSCGARLEANPGGDAFSATGLSAFRIPGDAGGRQIPIRRVLFDSPVAARAAIAAVGGVLVDELARTIEVDRIGEVARVFGVLGNVVDDDERTDANINLDVLAFDPREVPKFEAAARSVAMRSRRRLDRPDNERVHEKLVGGRLKFTPVNRSLAFQIEADLAPCALHLPWSVGGLDVPLGQACRTALRGFGFITYYGSLGRIDVVDGEPAFVTTRRISNPFGVDGFHTWEEPISDDIVDEDVGLLIEANARV